MNTKTKFAAALTVLTVATTLAMPSSEAQARRWGLGVGLVTGAVVGAAIASSYATPVYVGGVRRCHWQSQFDGLGNYMGKVRVCKIYY